MGYQMKAYETVRLSDENWLRYQKIANKIFGMLNLLLQVPLI